jgi:uncharacterized protein (DUF885 family)
MRRIVLLLIVMLGRCASASPINDFFEEYDRGELARSPMYQSWRGIKTDYGKWDDFTDAHAVAEHEIGQKALAEMRRRFDPEQLDAQERLSYRLFETQQARYDRSFAFRRRGYLFDQTGGGQSELPAFLINVHRIDDVSDAKAYVERLRGLGAALDQMMDEAKQREATGTLPPKWVFAYVIDDAQNVIKGAPFDSGTDDCPLLADLRAKVSKLQLAQEQKDAILNAAGDALGGSVKPAYERLLALMKQQQSRAGSDDGVWHFPDGRDYYNERLGYYTTTDLDAEQIHQLGLRQVARVHEEMRAILRQVDFKGELPAFFKHVREDKRFYYANTDQGRAEYFSEVNKAIDGMYAKLPQYFGVLPKARLVVKRVEPFRERSAGKAFYDSAAPDGSRPGTYYVNLYDMADMPAIEIEALAFHEGAPGHHLQLSIQQEMKDLPPFRRFGGFTAYVEGWGLYSEKLAKEMGFYADPYRDFGRLQLELHRAARLVVDTGIHAKRWTREQAIDYIRQNTADPAGGIVKAIERYITTPGQATAYMIGRLKITELRERARQRLGDKFDIRGFHDAVLTAGAVPLDVLEENVEAWVAKVAAATR